MTLTQTRVTQNLMIVGVFRRADGKILIRFTIRKAGLWQSIPLLCLFRLKDTGGSRMMTPALNDPLHARDPLVAPWPGMTFTWVWDAPADGYASGTLDGVTYQLAYTDVWCCEEIEDDDDHLPPPPWPPIPPPPVPPIDPPTIVPILPPSNPELRTEVMSSTEESALPAVLPPPRPGIPTWPNNRMPSRYRRSVNLRSPIRPSLYFARSYYDSQGRLVSAPPPTTPEVFPYVVRTDRSIQPSVVSVDAGTFFGSAPTTTEVRSTKLIAEQLGIGELSSGAPYQTSELFWQRALSVSQSSGPLKVFGFVPVSASYLTQRSIVYFGVRNSSPTPIRGVDFIVGVHVNNVTYLLTSPASYAGTGTVPPGTSVGNPVCVDWTQIPGGPTVFGAGFFVLLMVGRRDPIAGLIFSGVNLPFGVVPTPGSQATDLLGPGTRSIAGFPAGLQPAYEASVNGVGDEDTFIFVAARSTVSIVVQATGDALGASFSPKMELYDVNDMSTPIVTHSAPFEVSGAPIEPESHQIGWQGNLTVGNKYAIVVRHVTPHYSRRWTYRIFHIETVPQTGGTLSVVSGQLAGQISTAYGRQDVALVNDRTGESVFVHTNDIGVSFDIQRDAVSGSNGRRLDAVVGDVIDIVRPGPGVLYRRSQDLIGQVTV